MDLTLTTTECLFIAALLIGAQVWLYGLLDEATQDRRRVWYLLERYSTPTWQDWHDLR